MSETYTFISLYVQAAVILAVICDPVGIALTYIGLIASEKTTRAQAAEATQKRANAAKARAMAALTLLKENTEAAAAQARLDQALVTLKSKSADNRKAAQNALDNLRRSAIIEDAEAQIAQAAFEDAEKALEEATNEAENAQQAAKAASQMTTQAIRRVALKAIWWSAILALFTGLIGNQVLSTLGFDLAYLRIVAGILFGMLGLQQVRGLSSESSYPWATVAILPLTFPGLIGAGFMAEEMGYVQAIREQGEPHLYLALALAVATALGLALILMLMVPLVSRYFGKKPGRERLAVLLAGVISLLFAVAFISEGMVEIIQGAFLH